jgi:Tol biopolymer transport system component
MTNRVELDRRLSAWLEEEAARHAPGELHARFIEDMQRSRQRPSWATTERWISMETRARLGAVPRTAIILVIVGLLMAVAAGAIVVGSGGADDRASNGLIAFETLGDIYTVEPDGSDRQLLVEGTGLAEGPTWSPDGTRLAYWTALSPVGPQQLMVVDADGSDPVTVASDVIQRIGGLGYTAWSPDGSRLAFTATTIKAGQEPCVDSSSVLGDFCSSRVFVAAADGSTGAVQVGDPDMDARTVAWSPDGRTLAYGGGDAGTGIGLYLMDPDGTDIRRLDEVSGFGWAFLRLDWSPDGERIVATANEESWDIWVFPVDGSGETRVSDVSDDPEVTWDQLFPTYAADGTLAWVGGADGALTLLEEGGVPVPLAGLEGAGVPVWSPDGRLIATSIPTTPDLIVVDREGPTVATIDNVGSNPSWQRLGT